MKQDYVIKKYVRAACAAEAVALDKDTDVSECFLVEDRPAKGGSVSVIGFSVPMEDGIPYEAQRK